MMGLVFFPWLMAILATRFLLCCLSALSAAKEPPRSLVRMSTKDPEGPRAPEYSSYDRWISSTKAGLGGVFNKNRVRESARKESTRAGLPDRAPWMDDK